MKQQDRPLSPSLSIYQWRRTFLNLSMMGRVTGAALSIGMPLFVYFLWAVAEGKDRYDQAQAFFGHPIILSLLVLWIWAFSFHLVSGIRHLIWDTGRGFERASLRWSNVLVLVGATVVAAVICVALVLRH